MCNDHSSEQRICLRGTDSQTEAEGVDVHLDVSGTLHLDALTLADSRKGIVIAICLAARVEVIKGHKGPAQSDRFTCPRIEECVLELNICDVVSPLLTALACLTWRQQIHDAESAL